MIKLILLITLCVIIADALAMVVGFGFDTLITPILGLWLPFNQVLWITGVLHWFSSLWKLLLFFQSIDVTLVLLFGTPAVCMSFVGALLVGQIMQERLMVYLGIFLVLYAGMILLFPQWHVKAQKRYLILGGGLSGLCAGLFGIRGVIRTLFLTAFNMPKEVYISTVGVIGFLEDSARLTGYMLQGFARHTSASWFIFFVPATFVGAFIGRLLVARIPKSRFRTYVVFFLFIIGLTFIFWKR